MTASSVKIVISVHVQAHALYLCMCMRCTYVPYIAKLQPTYFEGFQELVKLVVSTHHAIVIVTVL